MSVIESKQHALKGKMTQVLETTAANTKALRELKLVFTKYITRLKENSDGSPSMSKFAIDSDAGAQVQAGERMAPSQVPCSKEAVEDDAYNMDFVCNTDTLEEGKTLDAMPQETLNGSPSPAATILPAIPPSAPKDTL
jgi:hypothetical protein